MVGPHKNLERRATSASEDLGRISRVLEHHARAANRAKVHIKKLPLSKRSEKSINAELRNVMAQRIVVSARIQEKGLKEGGKLTERQQLGADDVLAHIKGQLNILKDETTRRIERTPDSSLHSEFDNLRKQLGEVRNSLGREKLDQKKRIDLRASEEFIGFMIGAIKLEFRLRERRR
jgi:hypothetical protein